MDLIGQLDLSWVERVFDKYGLTVGLVLIIAFGLWKRVLPAAERWFNAATDTQKSNAESLKTLCTAQEQLTVTSVKSGENHAKTHKAGMVAADALQAFANTHSEQAGAAVKPHVEKIKEILDR